MDVRGSSPALAPVNSATNQPDFSAFNFTPSSIIGTNWGPVVNAFPGEFLYHTPVTTGGQTSALPPNATYVVGTLTYDLSKFGITPTSNLTVSIDGTDTVIGAEVPGQPATFTFVAPTFAPGQQALVPGNVMAGIAVSGGGTSGNSIQGNLIGTTATGRTALGGLIDGIFIDSGAANNTVGGTTLGSGNTIAFNGNGVVIGNAPTDTATVHDSVLGNNIIGNTGTAITLGNDRATPNGVNPGPAPNDGQNTPLITALALTSVTGTLASVPSTPFRIEVFATPVINTVTQAQVFLGFVNVTTNASGMVSFTLPVTTLPLGSAITATATNLNNGDTSESSPALKQLLVTTQPTVVSSSDVQTVTIAAQLLGDTGPVVSATIQFTVQGLPGAVSTTTTTDGVATVTFSLPADVAPGQYPIVATLLEDGVATTTASSVLIVSPPVTPPEGGGKGRRWSR